MIDLSPFANPALQFSGGKDSLACLYLLKDQLKTLKVYWLNTGDSCPETLAVIQEVRAWIPHFIEVKSDVSAWRDTNGRPSDLVGASNHFLGVAYGMSGKQYSSRFDCCYNNLMKPLHERMIQDGVDCVIRGTKLSDTGKVPAEGLTDYYTILLPLKTWTHAQVFDYLEEMQAPVNPIYAHAAGASAPECFNCTAWLDDGKAEYFRALHPEQLPIYHGRLREILSELSKPLLDLEGELNASR